MLLHDVRELSCAPPPDGSNRRFRAFLPASERWHLRLLWASDSRGDIMYSWFQAHDVTEPIDGPWGSVVIC